MDPRFGPHAGGDPAGPAEGAAPEEERILRRAREGDIQALEWLVERKRERAFRLARHVVGNDEDAKDVVQIAFIRVWRKIRRYRPGSGFDAWFHRIVMNLAIDSLRRDRARRRGLQELRTADAGPSATGAIPASLRRSEVGRIFDDLARDLPARQRAVFALREIEGMETEDVARILGLRPSTVRNHLYQARRALQEALRSRYPEYLPRPGTESDP